MSLSVSIFLLLPLLSSLLGRGYTYISRHVSSFFSYYGEYEKAEPGSKFMTLVENS